MQEEIQYRKIDVQYVITIRKAVESRHEIFDGLCQLREQIPTHFISGPAFCIFYYITNVEKGDDVEYGYPVINIKELSAFHPHPSPPLEIVEYLHTNSLADLGKSYQKVGQWTREHGILSEEFIREEYPEFNYQIGEYFDEEKIQCRVLIQFVIHNWIKRFVFKAREQLPEKILPVIIEGSEVMEFQTTELTKFQWIQAMLIRLEKNASDSQKYEILSRCSHVFPQERIDKARLIFETAHKTTGDLYKAIDVTLKFMEEEHGWGEIPIREGNILYAKKKPRDSKGYITATTVAEKRKAYCFCPLIRNHLEENISEIFCNCGLGWYRQQWEGILQLSLRIERHHSLLRGDDYCDFKIYLPEQ